MAAQSGLSEHTLRYYEKIGLIKPIPRDNSSGHRRYCPETIARIESLSCLRKCGLSIDSMRAYLQQLEQGKLAATRQKELFAAREREIAHEIEQLQIRRRYLAGKAAYWDAVERGEKEEAKRISEENHEIAALLKEVRK